MASRAGGPLHNRFPRRKTFAQPSFPRRRTFAQPSFPRRKTFAQPLPRRRTFANRAGRPSHNRIPAQAGVAKGLRSRMLAMTARWGIWAGRNCSELLRETRPIPGGFLLAGTTVLWLSKSGFGAGPSPHYPFTLSSPTLRRGVSKGAHNSACGWGRHTHWRQGCGRRSIRAGEAPTLLRMIGLCGPLKSELLPHGGAVVP